MTSIYYICFSVNGWYWNRALSLKTFNAGQ